MPESRVASEREAFRTCPLCEATCGLALDVVGDRVVRVRGDRDDVHSRGYICPKGTALGALHHDPDRLRGPRVKEGHGWREVSWDEAFERVGEGLAPFLAPDRDRDAVGLYLGNPNTHTLSGNLFLRPLIKALGTKNLFTAATVDQMPREVACGLIYGSPGALPVPDLERVDFLLLVGANPLESNGSLWTVPGLPERLREFRKAGGTLTVVDPIRTRTAELADRHLPIRPGSDAAWLLALCHTVVAEGLAQPGRLGAFTNGVDEVEGWLKPFSPERVEALCGISAEQTRQLARDFAAAPRAALYGRMGAHTVSFGTLAAWAIEVLHFLTGNLDREGGVMFPKPVHGRVSSGKAGGRGFKTGRWHSRVSGAPEVQSEFPSALLAEEIDTPGAGQIRAMITVGGNPVLSTPNGRRLDTALASLDFMVSVDPYLNETTRHADVILPPPSPLERSHYDLTFYGAAIRSIAHYSPPVFEPEGLPEAEILARCCVEIVGGSVEAVNDSVLRPQVEREVSREVSPIAGRDPDQILAALEAEDPCDRVVEFLVRTGPFGDGFGVDPEGLTFTTLREHPHGLDLGSMTPVLPGALSTPSGKIELAPPAIGQDLSRLLAEVDRPPAEGLLLIGRRNLRSNNSWMHNLEPLRRGRELCTLWMHPSDCAARGLRSGDSVEVVSEVGRVVIPLEETDSITPGAVSIPHGHGHGAPGMKLGVASARPGVSANDLTEGEIDPLSGNAVLNGVPVRVQAAS